jgi:hypothetical protein
MPNLKAQTRQKTAFLTGASSGIGKAAASPSILRFLVQPDIGENHG